MTTRFAARTTSLALRASVVMDILRTHPSVIVGGILQENPFFVPPDELLRELRRAQTYVDGGAG